MTWNSRSGPQTPEECLTRGVSDFTIIKGLCSRVPAMTYVYPEVFKGWLKLYKNAFHFQSLAFLSLLLNFPHKFVTGCYLSTPKLRQREHLSSVRKTALCDQLPRGARTSVAWPWVLLGPHPFSVPKYSKTSRHNCPQEKPVLNWGVCLCLIQGRHVRPMWKRGCDELNLPHSSTN